MARRSYRQHCALARALDLVGERWTLLVVRELLTGERRYKDLVEALPGIGTNLLATRLRELEEQGLVEHLGPHYCLTTKGQRLESAILALARFGAAFLHQPNPDDLWMPRWNVVALKYAFRPERAAGIDSVFEYDIDGVRVQAKVQESQIQTSAQTPWNPDLIIRTNGATLLALTRGEQKVRDAEQNGSLSIHGDRRLFRKSLQLFSL